jgi:hypothetical protein
MTDPDDALRALRAAQETYDEDETEAGDLREQAIRDADQAGVPRDEIAAVVGNVLVEETLGPK